MTVWVVAAVIAVMVWSLRSGARTALAGIGWYELFFLFLSSAFLGDCFETVYVFLGTGVLMSRSSLLVMQPLTGWLAVSTIWGIYLIGTGLALAAAGAVCVKRKKNR